MEELILKLREININKKKLEDEEKAIKAKLEKEHLTEEGYKNDYLTISYTKASETKSIDLKSLEEKEPELFNELLEDYTKVTARKASFSYRFK